MFANRIPPSAWAQSCRLLRVGLDAGLPIAKVVQKQGVRGPIALRRIMARVGDRLADGDSLADAFDLEKENLPPLYSAMIIVGEQTGNLNETLRELEEYFEEQASLRRMFRQQTFLPKLQLTAAIGVIVLFLLVLGWLNIKMDPLGFGTGWPGVLKFLTVIGVTGVLIYAAYSGIKNQLRFLAPIERLLLLLPGIGGTLQSILLSRFALGLKLTMGAGLPANQALKYSFDAAASSLYRRAYEHVKIGLRRGDSVHDALSRTDIFPEEFRSAIATAEEGGQIPEVMGRMAKNYQEEAAVRLKALTQVAAFAVYGCVAAMTIYFIFKIYSTSIAPAYEF